MAEAAGAGPAHGLAADGLLLADRDGGAADRCAAGPQGAPARSSLWTPETLRTIARQPLRPVEPQQPLDIGLFEIRPPDAPHIVMPDE